MAKRKASKSSSRHKRVIAVVLALVAALALISLVSHDRIDDGRITGEIDPHLNPFELSYQNQAGMLGAYLGYVFSALLGWLAYFVPLALFLLALRIIFAGLAAKFNRHAIIAGIVSLAVTMIYNVSQLASRTIGLERDFAGGWITESITELSYKLVGELGSYVLLSGVALLALMTTFSFSTIIKTSFRSLQLDLFRSLTNRLGKLWQVFISFGWLTRTAEDSDAAEPDRDNEPLPSANPARSDSANYAGMDDEIKPSPSRPRRKPERDVKPQQLHLSQVQYQYPPLDLLKENPASAGIVSRDELDMTARMLKETLESFGVHVEGTIDKFPGPVITRYEFKPGTGIKVSQISNLADDLALALKARRIRIIAPIPGKAAVGIEIPNRDPQIVCLREILDSPQYNNPKLILPLALGKTTAGKPFVTDLTRLPHLLVAGATGSGKSVCLNVLITSLLYRLHPHQVRFIMIDPKMLELTVYKGIPHMGRPAVTNPKRAEKVLADAVVEMESRYRKLANASVRNIADYNGKQTREEDKLPYIIIMVDELADLMISSGSSKIEMLITRLAQMARAVGIHLVLATQRPSVDVITGLIKANFPARIAFQVASKVDSRTILDANGAEKLLGAGDMLFMPPSEPEAMRIHGAYLDNDETDQIVSFIKDQGLEMMALEGISQGTGETTETEIDFGDPLFREACEVVVRHKQGSVSLLQRRLGIGYQRAARLIDKLEGAGIVSPFDGSKAREVMVDKPYIDALFTSGKSPEPVATDQN